MPQIDTDKSSKGKSIKGRINLKIKPIMNGDLSCIFIPGDLA